MATLFGKLREHEIEPNRLVENEEDDKKKKFFELIVTKAKDMESKGEGCQIQSNEDIDIKILKCEGFISHYYEKHFLFWLEKSFTSVS